MATMDVAIIGMGLRFPEGATTAKKFWEILANEQSAWSPIPAERFEDYSNVPVAGGHFMDHDIAQFDAQAFRIHAAEAESMDPQQRTLLEVSYEALENAGIPLPTLAGTETSVFVGKFTHDYEKVLSEAGAKAGRYSSTGTGHAIMANRLSYFFNLHGPSITIDTACSASLVAIHLARQSLVTGESKLSIVAGVNVMCHADSFVALNALGVLSRDGRSYPFDSRACGYGRGEGCGVLILKPLHAALQDGNPIRAVIRGSGVDANGQTAHLLFPGGEAQERLIRKVYADSGLDPRETCFIETHGTGTQVGDPIESRAIFNVFRKDKSPVDSLPLYMGSVKANIGHLEGASGVAGVVKAVLCLEKGFVPPNYGFHKPNMHMRLDEWKMHIPATLMQWPTGAPRRVSVNSFGYGGMNAHAIIDAAPNSSIYTVTNLGVKRDGEHRSFVFAFSAYDETAGERTLRNMASYIATHPDVDGGLMENLAFTLSEKRTWLPYRASVVSSCPKDLLKTLTGSSIRFYRSEAPRLGLVLTGFDTQWPDIISDLLQTYSVFQRTFDRADKFLQIVQCPWTPIGELLESHNWASVHESQLSTLLCTVFQIALVDLLESWNLHPTAVLGDSEGEIAAAYSAGALDFESALKVAYCGISVITANDASPHSMYESAADQFAVERFRDALQDIRPRSEGKAEFFSSSEGAAMGSSSLGPDYWAKAPNIQSRVSDALSEMCRSGNSNGVTCLLQVGTQWINTDCELNIPSAACLTDKVSTIYSLKTAMSTLVSNGFAVNLSDVNEFNAYGFPRTLVDLPPYPWTHSTRYWPPSNHAPKAKGQTPAPNLPNGINGADSPHRLGLVPQLKKPDQRQTTFCKETPAQSSVKTLIEPNNSISRFMVRRSAWTDDINLMGRGAIRETFPLTSPGEQISQMIHDLDIAANVYVQHAIETITSDDVSRMPKHHQMFYEVLKSRYIPSTPPKITLKRTSDSIQGYSAEGTLLSRIGENLLGIMRQEVDPLSLMLEGSVLREYYQSAAGIKNCHQHLADIVTKLAAINPKMIILEVGAGTGASTSPVLRALTTKGIDQAKLGRYDFTDVSPGFFANARSLLEPWSGMINYNVLDIGKDSAVQGFDDGTYDLIIAVDVLHVTENMQQSLQRIRRLLAPGGKLVVVDLTNTPLRWTMIFGTLPGWWLGTAEGRTEGPTISEPEWEELLRKTSFSGLDICLRDFSNSEQYVHSVMVTTAVEKRPTSKPLVCIVTGERQIPSIKFSPLLDTLKEDGFGHVSTSTLGTDPSASEGKICVLVASLWDNAESCTDAVVIEQIRQIARSSSGLLWVNHPSLFPRGESESCLISAVGAHLRAQDPSVRIATLEVDSGTPLFTRDLSGTISRVLQQAFLRHSGVPVDWEFRTQQRHVQVRRVI